MARPKEIAQAVAQEVGPTDSPREVVQIVKELTIKNGWSPPGFEDDFSDKVRSAVCRHLRQFDDLHAEGYYIAFHLFGLDDQFIAGRYRPDPSDDLDAASGKARRAQISEILQAVEALSADEFEELCQKLPELMEGERQAYKPRSNDQGIDFFSRVRFGSLISKSVIGVGRERQLNAWIVGQAKHYKETIVSTKDIRELVGSIELARAKLFSSESDPLENLQMKLCEPIFYCFFSSGQFTSGSKRLMERSGIIFLEGYDIAQFLADGKAGFENEKFDAGLLKEWITAD